MMAMILQVGPGQAGARRTTVPVPGPPRRRPLTGSRGRGRLERPGAAGGRRPKGPGRSSEWRAREDDRCRPDCRGRGIRDSDSVRDFGGPGGPGRHPRPRARGHRHPVSQ